MNIFIKNKIESIGKKMNEVAEWYYKSSKECIENSRFQECEIEYYHLKEELRDKLNKEDRKKLNRMIDCIFEDIKIRNLQSFANGFSVAMSLNGDSENDDNKLNTKISIKVKEILNLIENKASEEEINIELKRLDNMFLSDIK